LTALGEIIVEHKVGLHARPAALFVKSANTFSSEITLQNLTRDSEPANAKSILGVLASEVHMNDRIRITAEGEDEEEAITTLCNLIESNFGEPQ
jgi:phosphotransferase system HPr (HPr) family protein